MSKTLFKSGVIVSVMTFVSRVLGLARDIIVAQLMGAGAAADVFYFANKIPNFLRRLFAEGAFAQAFVPVLAEVKETQSLPDLKLFIARTAGTLGVLVTLITIIGVIGSPIVAALFGPGWFNSYLEGGEHGDKFVLASDMLKITFPYLWFITLAGLSGAILNTFNRFSVAAFTPVLLNVAIISCAIWLAPYLEQPAFALAWGVFIGGACQLLFQLPFLRRAGLLVRPQWGWRDPDVKKVRTLMIPALFGVSVSQINLLLDTVIASFLVTGSISWLYYSDRLLEFPLGVFGIAIATVILPALSKHSVNNNTKHFQQTLSWALKSVIAVGVPAAAALMLLAYPLIKVMFQRGAFTDSDAQMASYSLLAYGAGLIFFMFIKIFAPAFYAQQDTKTPVKYGVWAMASNMLFNVIFAIPFGYVGLAMATSLSAALNAGLLYRKLHVTGIFRLSSDVLLFAAKIVLATLCMVLLCNWINPSMAAWQNSDLATRISYLVQLVVAGLCSFVLVSGLLGIRVKDFVKQT